MFHPTRGGTRGGRDQFSWEDVETSKHREFYLGHSVKAPVKRFAARTKTDNEPLPVADDLSSIQYIESQLMAEALGLQPREKDHARDVVSKRELARLLDVNAPDTDEAASSSRLGMVEKRLGISTGGRVLKEVMEPEYESSGNEDKRDQRKDRDRELRRSEGRRRKGREKKDKGRGARTRVEAKGRDEKRKRRRENSSEEGRVRVHLHEKRQRHRS